MMYEAVKNDYVREHFSKRLRSNKHRVAGQIWIKKRAIERENILGRSVLVINNYSRHDENTMHTIRHVNTGPHR